MGTLGGRANKDHRDFQFWVGCTEGEDLVKAEWEKNKVSSQIKMKTKQNKTKMKKQWYSKEP